MVEATFAEYDWSRVQLGVLSVVIAHGRTIFADEVSWRGAMLRA